MAVSRTSFQKGGPGGPGRPKRATEQNYLDATMATVSVGDWRVVVAKALAQAKDGETARPGIRWSRSGREPVPDADGPPQLALWATPQVRGDDRGSPGRVERLACQARSHNRRGRAIGGIPPLPAGALVDVSCAPHTLRRSYAGVSDRSSKSLSSGKRAPSGFFAQR
jgi:hypothetical protein